MKNEIKIRLDKMKHKKRRNTNQCKSNGPAKLIELYFKAFPNI
jgi:hypothetical protein